MSTYITESRCKYEIADRKLDEALEWMEDNMLRECRSAAYRQDTSIVTGVEEMFGGEVSYSWHENVADFMELFCLPGSYATFRNDEEFEWYMAELKSDGRVHWDDVSIDNPFEARCNELENDE